MIMTNYARELEIERPDNWEGLLFEELVNAGIVKLKTDHESLMRRSPAIFRPRRLSANATCAFISAKLEAVGSLMQQFKAELDMLIPVLDDPDDQTRMGAIHRASNRVFDIAAQLLNVDSEFEKLRPNRRFETLFNNVRGIGWEFVDRLQLMTRYLGNSCRGVTVSPKEWAVIMGYPRIQTITATVLKLLQEAMISNWIWGIITGAALAFFLFDLFRK